MVFNKLFKGNSEIKPDNLSEAAQEVAKNYKLGEFTQEDCENCSVCYPKSLKVDDDPLFNTALPISAQIIVATGQNNWKHEIGDETTDWGRVCRVLSESSPALREIVGGPVRINGSNLEYDDAENAHKVSVTILPQFVRILTDPDHCLEQVATVLKLKPTDKLSSNMMAVPDRGYILLCSHTTRDKRCGITAPLMKKALEIELRDKDLYRDPDDEDEGGIRVVLANHMGGHKFAANALIYQKNGMALMLARLRPEHAKGLVEKTIEQGIVVPEFVRCSNKIDAYSW